MKHLVWLAVGLLTVGCRLFPRLTLGPTTAPEATRVPVPQYRTKASSPAATPRSRPEAGWETASLSDRQGGRTAGIARRFNDGQRFVFKVQVEKMPALARDQFYEVWLRKILGGLDDWVRLGRLEADPTPGVFYLQAEPDQPYAEYRQILITLEQLDDNQPERVLVEGNF